MSTTKWTRQSNYFINMDLCTIVTGYGWNNTIFEFLTAQNPRVVHSMSSKCHEINIQNLVVKNKTFLKYSVRCWNWSCMNLFKSDSYFVSNIWHMILIEF